jgi:hypothetical protein
MYSGISTSPIVLVVVLVLDFFGRWKRADCQQRSKNENEDEHDDEDEHDSQISEFGLS